MFSASSFFFFVCAFCKSTLHCPAGYTEDDALKMTAKINFFATKLGDHDNVIKFLGAVMDNKHCEPGFFFDNAGFCHN